MFRSLMQGPSTITFAVETSRLRLLDVVYPPETDFDTHVHREAYACLVTQGRIQEWSPRGRTLRAGMDHVWPAGSRHAVRTGADAVRMLHVCDPEGGGRLLDHPLRTGLLLQLARALSSIAGPGYDAERLHLECLVAEFAEPSPGPVGSERTVREGRASWMARVRERLRQGVREGVGLDELSRVAGRHPSHLTRAFRRRWGMTPGEYLRRLRVAEAVRLLRQTDLPLSHVAFGAGFSDQSHMGRWMRRYTGATPAGIRMAGDR